VPHFYLAPYTGTGPFANPFRIRGSDQPGWSQIDCRPRPNVVAGLGWLAVPVRNDQPTMDYLGDQLDSPSAANRLTVGNRLGITPQNQTVRGLLAEVLTQHGREDGSRWRNVRPGRDGLRRIYLGGQLVWPSGVGAAIAENWTCPDSDDLTCQLPWTVIESAGVPGTGPGWRLVGNAAQLAGTDGENVELVATAFATDNHEVEAPISTFTYVSGLLICGIRTRMGDGLANNGYQLDFRPDTGQLRLLRADSFGSFTLLGETPAAVAVGDVLFLRSDGSTHIGRLSGVDKLTVTDPVLSGTLHGGLYGNTNTAGNVFAFGAPWRGGGVGELDGSGAGGDGSGGRLRHLGHTGALTVMRG
jgi:hypothetical protein